MKRSSNCVYKRRGTTWNSYRAAKFRCSNPNASDYKYYGGRGIQFRFTNFDEFIQLVGFKPSPKHTLERIDVNGHYEAGNVEWATRKEQMNNMRRNAHVTAFGKTLTPSQWADEIGASEKDVMRRLRRGWCAECCLTVGPRGTCTHGFDPHARSREKAKDRRNTRWITAFGVTQNQRDWSRQVGISETALSARLSRGWCNECAVSLVMGRSCLHKNFVPQ